MGLVLLVCLFDVMLVWVVVLFVCAVLSGGLCWADAPFLYF